MGEPLNLLEHVMIEEIEDRLVWVVSKEGAFTVKSFRDRLRNKGQWSDKLAVSSYENLVH